MTAENKPILKQLLINFLEDKEGLEYPPMIVEILSFNPLKITDDNLVFLELSDIIDEAKASELEKSKRPHRLELKEWNFVFRRIPNTHEYYFDIVAKEFNILQVDSKIPEDLNLAKISSVCEDPKIR